MKAESLAKSIGMLKGILHGKTYVAVALESGSPAARPSRTRKAHSPATVTVVGVEWVGRGRSADGERNAGAKGQMDASKRSSITARSVSSTPARAHAR